MPSFVSFEQTGCGYRAFTTIDAFAPTEKDPEAVLLEAGRLYTRYVTRIRKLRDQVEAIKAGGRKVPARRMWTIGNTVFELAGQLQQLSLEIDGLYDHLERDVGINRKTLERIITFRRYIPSRLLIPRTLTWSRCIEGTRRIAERIAQGQPLA